MNPLDCSFHRCEKAFMSVKSAARSVEVFELFARTQTPLSLSELARGLHAPVSSCFQLIRTLEAHGYLYALAGNRIYPTRKLFNIGSAITAAEPWMQQIEPKLVALRDATRETIILGTWQGYQAVYLAVVEGPQNVRYSAQVGDLKPLYSSSIGKALLSAMSRTEREKIVGKIALKARTEFTITNRSALLADLERCAKLGIAETRGENVPDVMAIAKPVRLGEDVYAIAVAGPMHRMRENVSQHKADLEELCVSIKVAP